VDHVTELASGARFMARFNQLYIATTHLRLSEFSEPGCIGQLGQMASRSAHPFYPFIQLPHNLYAFHWAGHPLIVFFPLVGRDLGIWEQSIGMSVSVCLFVCLFVRMFVCLSANVSPGRHVQSLAFLVPRFVPLLAALRYITYFRLHG